MLPLILRLDLSGKPLRWISWQHAVVLSTRDMIAWNAGESQFTLCGGYGRDGSRSQVTIHSIIAVKGHVHNHGRHTGVPRLSNRELFLRDGHLCLYCGRRFPEHLLTRDHVRPLSKGGEDCWSNVVTACKGCNHAKGARTPEEAGMQLIAVPFIPNRAEYLVLSNRRILADQMDFLSRRFRSASRMMVCTAHRV